MSNEEISATKTSKGELKAKMFEYLRQVEETGKPLIVTDRGEPTVVIYPYIKKASVDEIFSPLRGKYQEHGDILESENDAWGELA